jgi:hypothetical protein
MKTGQSKSLAHLLSKFEKWTKSGIETLGAWKFCLTFLAFIQFIIIIGIIIYCIENRLPGGHVITELEWRVLGAVLLLFTLIILILGLSLISPFVIYRMTLEYILYKNSSVVSKSPFKIWASIFSFSYSVYFCCVTQAMTQNALKITWLLPLTTLLLTTFWVKKNTSGKKKDDFFKAILVGNIASLIPLIFCITIFFSLCSQIAPSWINWEEPTEIFFFWGGFYWFPLTIIIAAYFSVNYSLKHRLRPAREFYFFMGILGVLTAFFIWPGAGFLMDKTFAELKIGGNIPIEIGLDHTEACRYKSFIKEDKSIIEQVCNPAYSGRYQLTLGHLYLVFGAKENLYVYFYKPNQSKGGKLVTILKEHRPSITYLLQR